MLRRFLSKLLLGLVGVLVITVGVSIFTATNASTNFFYTFTNLGVPKGSTASIAKEINESGQVVGYGAKDGPFRAFFWEKGVMTDIGTLGGLSSFTYRGINNKGQVVGLAETQVVLITKVR
jgi:probable HAF family extracellular repeat protein